MIFDICTGVKETVITYSQVHFVSVHPAVEQHVCNTEKSL